jgi:hypothetical protein
MSDAMAEHTTPFAQLSKMRTWCAPTITGGVWRSLTASLSVSSSCDDHRTQASFVLHLLNTGDTVVAEKNRQE